MAETKKFGYWTILALAIGSIIGTGMFTGAALGANFSGNMVIVAWIILSVIAVYIAGCFGELSAMFPKSGGVYEYGKQAYGRFISFMIGWTAWIVGTVTIALLIVTAVNFLLPNSNNLIVKIGISVALVLVLNLIAFVGVQISSFVLIAFAVIMITVILTIITKGFGFVNFNNFSPFFTNDFSSVFITLFFLAESYFGWEAVTYLAEETNNPRKIIPRALMIGTLIVSVLGLLMMIVMLGIVPYAELAQLCTPSSASCDPISGIADLIFAGNGFIISFGIVLIMIGSAAGGIITLPRLLMALARDKLMLGQLNQMHPTFKTPYKGIAFQTIVLIIVLIIGFAEYQTLLSILVPIAIILYILSLLAVTVLRNTKPDAERSFKVPFGKIGPIITSILFAGVIVFWLANVEGSLSTLLLGISLILFGIPLYFLIEMYYDPKMITSVNDIFSYLTLTTEHISVPRGIRKEIINFLGDIKGKTILEFGCSVGTLTIPLAEAVGTKGNVYATHFSQHDLKIVRKRLINKRWETEKRIYGRVKLIHDFEHFVRLHPDVEYADAAVSIGMLSYLQEPKKVLSQIASILPPDGKICFVEYGDFFHILPNKEWLSNNRKIAKVFRDAGLSVKVERKKGLFWNYIFIYGLKLGKGVAYV